MTADNRRDAATSADPESMTPVPSPCNSVCRMDANGRYCVGCLRTLDEIAGWAGFDDARRRLIWKELRQRGAQAARSACEPPR
jgi:hypothetical protein